MKQIALIGECMIELNGAPFGALSQTFGGDSLNTALYLARLQRGKDSGVHYVTALGEDALSAGLLQRWQEEGITTDLVLRDPVRQAGLYWIQLDAHGERTFLYWRSDSAARYLVQHADFAAVMARLRGFDMVYLSGISLAILPAGDRHTLIAHLAQLAANGVKIVFDGNYRPRLWVNPAEAQTVYAQLSPHVALALVTFDDERALWGDADPAATIARLQRAGVAEVVVKMGAEGAIYAHGETVLTVPTEKVAAVVDTTAAGDSFNAGFLAAYLAGAAPAECCATGNRLAGRVIQHQGAIIPAHYCNI